MADIFFYGTLRHIDLLELVLERPRDRIDLSEAELPDHAVVGVQGQPFPTILPMPGQRARGLLACNLGTEDLARLRFYEGGFDHDLRRLEVETEGGERIAADVFFAAPEKWQAGDPWSLEEWRRDWGDMTMRVATEAMSLFHQADTADLAALLPAMRRRAASFLAARSRPADPDRDIARDVEVIARSQPYTGFLAIAEMDLRFRRHDGAMSEVQNRSALLTGQAAVVLPYDPVRDSVLLIQQFRAPLFIAGDRAPWVWEPVAGYVDPGEAPETTARREAMEEAGLTLHALESAGRVYSSTGNSTEFVHLFIGIADLSERPEGGGLDSEGEDILTRILSYDDLMADIDAQRFNDLPLVTTALWLARHRDRLRDAA